MNRLANIKGAWPYLFAVFLNAFVDLGHKIIIQNTIFKVYDGQQQVLLTALVNGLILRVMNMKRDQSKIFTIT